MREKDKCKCGNEKDYRAARCCTCGLKWRSELMKRRNLKHGESYRSKKSREYTSYHNMMVRCYKSNSIAYNNYGGRGITVCERWRTSFQNFLDDMGRMPSDKHQIDRINNNGNYEPSNCRWATSKQNARNTRRNRLIEIDGISHPISEWSEISGIQGGLIHWRIKKGWIPRDAIFKPPMVCGKKGPRKKKKTID
jgi:hypothetical protein